MVTSTEYFIHDTKNSFMPESFKKPKYRIRSVETRIRTAAANILRILNLGDMQEDVVKYILDNKFTGRLSLDNKVCVVVFHICKVRGIPIVASDIDRVFSKTRSALLKIMMHQFKCHMPNKAYYPNVFQRFSTYLNSIGAETPNTQAYARFTKVLEMYPHSPLELVAVSTILENQNYEEIYNRSNLDGFFALPVLRCFIRKLEAPSRTKSSGTKRKKSFFRRIFTEIRRNTYGGNSMLSELR